MTQQPPELQPSLRYNPGFLGRVILVLATVVWGLQCTVGSALAQRKLSLKEAEAIAIKNHPQVSAAMLRALAANQVTSEVRAGFYPNFFGSLTTATALDNSRIGAGGLNNPIIFNRVAAGLTVSQLITDFGRTGNLAESARLRARAEEETVKATRAEVLLQVDRAYFAALRSQAVLKVADQTVAARQLVVDQVRALANSKLKSELDVRFAMVNLAEAKLLLAAAQNQTEAAMADLVAALGSQDEQRYDLIDEPIPGGPSGDLSQLISDALQYRPELQRSRTDYDSARRFAAAEKDLRLPTLSALGALGLIPIHDSVLGDRYAAAGVNINIPIFNGRLFSARQAEAELRAQAAEQNVRDLQNRIARDVRVAWLNANNAYQRLDLTSQLLNQAVQALDLAQQRYNLGLGSIVELSQAQLNRTSAEIENSSAKYEYQTQRSVLNYQIGLTH